MTLNNLIPWGKKNVPIRRTEDYNPPAIWSEFDEPFREIDRLFDRFLGSYRLPMLSTMTEQFSPSLDVNETEKEFQINVEVPGMDEKDIDIQMSKDILKISGEKKEEREENAKGVYRVERRYGGFTRTIPLPENCVDVDGAEASYKNGVLKIRLPKTANYRESVKKIPVLTKSEDASGEGVDTSRN